MEKEHPSRIEKNIDQHLIVKKQDIIERFYEAEKNLNSLKESKMIMDK
jgi:hypothetical protein